MFFFLVKIECLSAIRIVADICLKTAANKIKWGVIFVASRRHLEGLTGLCLVSSRRHLEGLTDLCLVVKVQENFGRELSSVLVIFDRIRFA